MGPETGIGSLLDKYWSPGHARPRWCVFGGVARFAKAGQPKGKSKKKRGVVGTGLPLSVSGLFVLLSGLVCPLPLTRGPHRSSRGRERESVCVTLWREPRCPRPRPRYSHSGTFCSLTCPTVAQFGLDFLEGDDCHF